MKHSKKRSKSGGFSLIEILFGIFIVALCATVLSATMPTANQSRVKANNVSKAINLAQKQMEAIRCVGYASITPERLTTLGLLDSQAPIEPNTFSFSNVDNGIFDNPSTVLTAGTGTVLIRQSNLDIKEVTIVVAWTEKGVRRNFRLGTKIANL